MLSPSGRPVVANYGPLNAEVLLLGESPAGDEIKEGQPFVGAAGRMLNKGLGKAGLLRTQCRLANTVPARAPQDKFALHSAEDLEWGLGQLNREISKLPNLKLIVALGANPTKYLLGRVPPTNHKGDGFISDWRGSIISPRYITNEPEGYLREAGFTFPYTAGKDIAILPTFHPSAINYQFSSHPLFINDLKRAAVVLRQGVPELPKRRWFWNQPSELTRLTGVDLISVDTEMNPATIAIATDEEVHVMLWDDMVWQYLEPILRNPRILKICHNWFHDFAFIRKYFGIEVARPIYDSQGGAAILHSALPKDLSPGVASMYTYWPHHKWLSGSDTQWYCGLDAIVPYDAYWNQIEAQVKKGVFSVSEHDHKLLTPLLNMQSRGFRVDEGERKKAEDELQADVDKIVDELDILVRPVIQKKLGKFTKPHLFKVMRKCGCCGGGTKQRAHCVACSPLILPHQDFITRELANEKGFKTIKALMESLGPCEICQSTGKVEKWLEFNPDSDDQVADVLYRGLGIRPRKFKGKETVKAAQLDPLKDEYPIVAKVVEFSNARADLDTIQRLTPGLDGKLHCIFDPWGTGSGRVAGKESLVEPGTNPMNIPKKSRRLVVPDRGYIFLYPDKSQVEARSVALLSGDKNLKAAFNTAIDWPEYSVKSDRLGKARHGTVDSHSYVVQLMDGAGVWINRDTAKRLTYGAMYGGGAPQMCVELNAEMYRLGLDKRYTVEEVDTMIQTFFSVFSGVRQYHEWTVDEVYRTRELRCPYTKRVFEWPGYIIDKKTKEVLREVKKQIWSRLPQNMGAWVLGKGLIDLEYNTDYIPSLIQPLIHVHDALLFQVPLDRVDEAEIAIMSKLDRVEFGMEFPSEMKRGMNWYEAS